MTRPLIVLPEAEEELADAMRFYEARRGGLGVAFLGAVEQGIQSLGLIRLRPSGE